MPQKPNSIFVASVTLKTEVMTPKRIGFLMGLWGSYILWFNLTAVILFELSHGNCSDPKIDPVTPILNPVTPKYMGILPDPRQLSVPGFKLMALELLELCSSDSQNWLLDPKMNRDLSPPTMCVYIKFYNTSRWFSPIAPSIATPCQISYTYTGDYLLKTIFHILVVFTDSEIWCFLKLYHILSHRSHLQ